MKDTQPPAEDPRLLDELPYAPALLAYAPAELRARIYAAFQVHALYRATQNQATITDATPALIAALLTDPRTDHDTADPARKNRAIAPMTAYILRRDKSLRVPQAAAGGSCPGPESWTESTGSIGLSTHIRTICPHKRRRNITILALCCMHTLTPGESARSAPRSICGNGEFGGKT